MNNIELYIRCEDRTLVIYGAQAMAYTAYKAFSVLTTSRIRLFLVTDKGGQPKYLDNIPVEQLSDYNRKNEDLIIVATPENVQYEISCLLEKCGIKDYICLPSTCFSELQRDYYNSINLFPSILGKVEIYQAVHNGDRKLINNYKNPEWLIPIQVGHVYAESDICVIHDDLGDNISARNGNYSELTAMYWAWKNSNSDIKGICHYRRIPEIGDCELSAIFKGEADVILPYPMEYFPNASEHHKRYLSESEWTAVTEVIAVLSPEYLDCMKKIMDGNFFINYNIIVARKDVFDNYCEWLFELLFEIGKKINPPEIKRSDRFMGYIGENLYTIYFLSNLKKLKIRHCGCLMRT